MIVIGQFTVSFIGSSFMEGALMDGNTSLTSVLYGSDQTLVPDREMLEVNMAGV